LQGVLQRTRELAPRVGYFDPKIERCRLVAPADKRINSIGLEVVARIDGDCHDAVPLEHRRFGCAGVATVANSAGDARSFALDHTHPCHHLSEREVGTPRVAAQVAELGQPSVGNLLAHPAAGVGDFDAIGEHPDMDADLFVLVIPGAPERWR